jgi:hydroxylaminobenzene mutase
MTITITRQSKTLILFGAVLFLIGLGQGGLIPFFTNPRMALSAHLAAVQSGMALMIFGVIWALVVLPEKWLARAMYSGIGSMYLIWFSLTLAAALGASNALPIAGAGYSSSLAQEWLVEGIVTLGAALGIISGLLVVIGLAKNK